MTSLSSKIPNDISDDENITRILYHPKFVTSNDEIRANAFKSQKGMDEISIIRLNYSSLDFCKVQGQKYQDSTYKKNYFGLAFLKAKTIRFFKATVVSTPDYNNDNPAHGDIQLGYVAKKGEELPAEYNWKAGKLAMNALLIKDTTISSKKWSIPLEEIETKLANKKIN